jgi:Leucine-rich repeat (LRR) protein
MQRCPGVPGGPGCLQPCARGKAPAPAALTADHASPVPARSVIGGKGLQGIVPQPAGWVLPDYLEQLDLNNNAISGSLPPALALPANLTVLDLRANKLEGTIPAGLRLPAGLRRLHLGFNGLSGTVPESLALPETLEAFVLAR